MSPRNCSGLWVAIGAASMLAPLSALQAAPSTVDDRIIFSANGESLTGTSGGGGGSLGWLHNFSDSALAGVGVEHQVLANAHWTFGSLNGSYGLNSGDTRYTLYGELHEGGGNSGARSLGYHVEVLGAAATYFHRLSLTLEDRQISIDTVSGNLPKLGVSYLWNPHVQTTLNYAYSAGANLGTRLLSGKIDFYQPGLNWFGGFSFGQATAAVLFQVGTEQTSVPGLHLKEGYVGATLPLPRQRSEISLILDYQNLSNSQADSKRFQGTLNYIFHVGHH